MRRTRLTLAGSTALSVIMLGAWFPATSLLHQHRALAAASAQLAELRREDRALAQEQRLLKSPAEVARIAREQYQLVSPGQRLYEVLPPSGSGGSGAYAGDPGLQPLVSPSAAAELPRGTLAGSGGAAPTGPAATSGSAATRGSAATGAAPGTGATHGSPGFIGRIVQTLEFWR